jgi:hypothetical protein
VTVTVDMSAEWQSICCIPNHLYSHANDRNPLVGVRRFRNGGGRPAPDLLTNDKKNHSEKHVAACTTSKEVHNSTRNVLTQCPVAYSPCLSIASSSW